MTEIAVDNRLSNLSPAAARLGATLARPRAIAVLCVVTLAGIGWVYLGFAAGRAASAEGGLPGLLAALCGPSSTAGGLAAFGFMVAMWSAMTLAMMVPSAGPMILTYAEIADTAAGKGAAIVSPFVLAGGYTAVWLGFSVAAAALQYVLNAEALLAAGTGTPGFFLSGALFIGAGLYQFSTLKQACLALCQRPFPFLFANWTTRTSGVFRLGLRQGLHCLGCCWAMMLLMFAVGVMNTAWMVALGIIMTTEKLTTTPRFSRVLGVAFIATGAAFIVSGFL